MDGQGSAVCPRALGQEGLPGDEGEQCPGCEGHSLEGCLQGSREPPMERDSLLCLD